MAKCSNCGVELEPGMKFCVECGTPVPQTKTCPKCSAELPLKMKFCPECGCNVNESAAPTAGLSMGDKNVISGDVVGQKVDGDNVGSKIMGNVINNTTMIKDETKSVNACAVCGKHMTNDSGHTCPKCGNIVCSDDFDNENRCCKECSEKMQASLKVDLCVACGRRLVQGTGFICRICRKVVCEKHFDDEQLCCRVCAMAKEQAEARAEAEKRAVEEKRKAAEEELRRAEEERRREAAAVAAAEAQKAAEAAAAERARVEQQTQENQMRSGEVVREAFMDMVQNQKLVKMKDMLFVKGFNDGTYKKNKIVNGINAFAQEVAIDDVIVFYDATMFGSGKNGFLITAKKIYFDGGALCGKGVIEMSKGGTFTKRMGNLQFNEISWCTMAGIDKDVFMYGMNALLKKMQGKT